MIALDIDPSSLESLSAMKAVMLPMPLNTFRGAVPFSSGRAGAGNGLAGKLGEHLAVSFAEVDAAGDAFEIAGVVVCSVVVDVMHMKAGRYGAAVRVLPDNAVETDALALVVPATAVIGHAKELLDGLAENDRTRRPASDRASTHPVSVMKR